MRPKLATLLLAAICLGGCVTRATQLYPDNDIARATGPLTAVIEGHGNLNGTMTMTMPSGEMLAGRYSIGAAGAVGFGTAGRAFGSAMFVGAQGVGVADMLGPRGTTAHCEFANNNFNGHGNGVCRLSTGAVYRMQY